jgi:hypothetical protein
MLKRLPKLNLAKTKKPFDFNLPVDFVVSKFYEYGYKVTYNRHANTYQSCCPLCREGNSWGRKKRCFFIPDNNNIYCHNCGSSLTPYNWIKEVSGMTHHEIEQALNDDEYDVQPSVDVDNLVIKPQCLLTLPEDSINLFDPYQINYYKDNDIIQKALVYIKSRRLDSAINKPDAIYLSLKDNYQSNRLVIPFKDETGKIVFYQTRKIFSWDDKPNYLGKANSDKTLYGIDKVDPDLDTVFLFEGPIDSFFIKNGIAVAGINRGHCTLTNTQKLQMESLKLFDKIWVLDSQWVDDTSREKTVSLLETGETVFLWPKKYSQFKDINELCVKHSLDQVSPQFIKKNSECGPSAILKFKMLFR